MNASELIGLYGLLRHPEGGWFRESHRSTGVIPRSVLPAAFAGQRCYSTAVFFLLQKGERSLLHRLASEEVWHFWRSPALGPARPGGRGGEHSSWSGRGRGQKLQHVVPAGTWFRPSRSRAPVFIVGATVAPASISPTSSSAAARTCSRDSPAAEAVESLTEPG